MFILNDAMHNNEPEDYRCPFCCIVAGIEGEHPLTKQADIIYRDTLITAFISSHWRLHNKGHVIIIPNVHVENLYDISDDLLGVVHAYSKKVARALKIAYGCAGVTIRQNNESAGDQDIWHYHVHVVPRFEADNFSSSPLFLSESVERALFAEKMKRALDYS